MFFFGENYEKNIAGQKVSRKRPILLEDMKKAGKTYKNVRRAKNLFFKSESAGIQFSGGLQSGKNRLY